MEDTMSKPMNHRRRLKALENATPAKTRNPYALACSLRNGAGNHGDKRKKASKKACRGRVRDY